MVIVDRRSKYIAAHVVKEKGDGSAIKALRQELYYMGYKRISCRNGQESPVDKLKESVKREWHGEMAPENSPAA